MEYWPLIHSRLLAFLGYNVDHFLIDFGEKLNLGYSALPNLSVSTLQKPFKGDAGGIRISELLVEGARKKMKNGTKKVTYLAGGLLFRIGLRDASEGMWSGEEFLQFLLLPVRSACSPPPLTHCKRASSVNNGLGSGPIPNQWEV
ncbi:hypothetical protein OUZ56_033480 [Daphnia magna]|uniref:Uncharacterized protein n=1 Tax=Daphnia magna TaxID=35525 RepID=A0ABR0BAS6_9CRUS|nr:hypothetical protein OUZ56_033480 [Daphnia magna]